MMLSLYFTAFWWIMRGADFMRPSALHRGFTFLWMYVTGWVLLVIATVLEDRFQIATGYIFVFFEASLFLAALITLLELFALPTKSEYARFAQDEDETRDNIQALPHSDALIGPGAEDGADEEPTENTPLFGGDADASRIVPSFANYARRCLGGGVDGANDRVDHKVRIFSIKFSYFTNIQAAQTL
jgi:hypothetical protein